nr:hypothetical protein [Tanacetum cinerariifolium]
WGGSGRFVVVLVVVAVKIGAFIEDAGLGGEWIAVESRRKLDELEL